MLSAETSLEAPLYFMCTRCGLSPHRPRAAQAGRCPGCGAPAYRPEPFRIELLPDRDRVVVRPVGELDVDSGPELDRELVELRGAGWRRLVLDLGGLSFLCSTGLHLLVRWTRAAREDRFELTLLPGSPQVQRVFDLTRLADELPFARDGHVESGRAS